MKPKTRIFLQLQLKRAFRVLPQLVLGAIALSFVISAIAFCGSKLLYHNENKSKLQVGLVGEESETSKYGNLAISMLGQIESTQTTCEFILMDKESAYEEFYNGRLAAVLFVPENFVQSIMNGTNTPATLLMRQDTSGLNSALIKELTESGAMLLSSSESGIYSADYLFSNYGNSQSKKQANTDLNAKYLDVIFSREASFSKTQISATNSLSTLQYYMGAGLTVFLLIWGLSCSTLIQNTSRSLEMKLASMGVSYPIQFLIQLFSLFLVYTATFLGITLCLKIALFAFPSIAKTLSLNGLLHVLSFVCGSLFVLLFTSTFILLLYQLTSNTISGMLLLFILTVFMAFFSGCILPQSFLPDQIHSIGRFLPTGLIMKQFHSLILGKFPFSNTVWLLLESILCSIVAYLVSNHRRERSL